MLRLSNRCGEKAYCYEFHPLPPHSSSNLKSWAQSCATPTSLANCISRAYTQSVPMYIATSSMCTFMCSAYSSSSSAALARNEATACHPCDGGWRRGHRMGWQPTTGKQRQASGWTTTTETATATFADGSVATPTQTKTATIVAAVDTAGSTHQPHRVPVYLSRLG